MKTIHLLILNGGWGDISILGAFSTQDLANAERDRIREIRMDTYEIYEFSLDEPAEL